MFLNFANSFYAKFTFAHLCYSRSLIELRKKIPIIFTAVQNERDRISCRRPSNEEPPDKNKGPSKEDVVKADARAEMLSKQVGRLEVSEGLTSG